MANSTQLAVFFLLAAGMMALYFGGDVADDLEFPTLDLPEPDFIDVSGGCSGFFDCTEYLANVFYNLGAGVISGAVFTYNLLVFLVAVFVFFIDAAAIIIENMVEAPSVVKVIAGGLITIIASMWLYRLATGRSES